MTAENEFDHYMEEQKRNPSSRGGVYEENVKYAFSVKGEIEKNLILLPGEVIEHQQSVTFGMRPAEMVLTNQRLIFLRHFFFSADRLLSIPLSHVKAIALKLLIYIQYDEMVERLYIRGGRYEPIKKMATEALFTLLKNKLSGVAVSPDIIPRPSKQKAISILLMFCALLVLNLLIFSRLVFSR